MSWVQVGPHKINTALICYTEQEGDTVRIYFHGEWEGNPLDLHLDEAKSFWKHLKAEDVMYSRDKGSAAVMPRLRSAVAMQVGPDGLNHDRPKPATPPSTHSTSHSTPHSSSQSASHSHSHHTKHGEASRSSEHKRH